MIDPELEQRIRDGFERWNSGEHSIDPRWMTADIEIHTAVGGLSGTVYRGEAGLKQWVDDMHDVFDEWQLELDEIEEFAPGRVLAVGRAHLRGRGSGVTVDQPCAWLMDHVDGVLTRFEPLLNRVDEAREIAARG